MDYAVWTLRQKQRGDVKHGVVSNAFHAHISTSPEGPTHLTSAEVSPGEKKTRWKRQRERDAADEEGTTRRSETRPTNTTALLTTHVAATSAGSGPSSTAASDWLRRGRLFGALRQSERRILDKGVWEKTLSLKMWATSVYLLLTRHAHAHASDFNACGTLRTSHEWGCYSWNVFTQSAGDWRKKKEMRASFDRLWQGFVNIFGFFFLDFLTSVFSIL